jgi:isoleucyl-tRNA synthetase
MKRVKEVMDVWFDSGAMPFAQDHYPFEGKKGGLLGRFGGQKLAYPADFISEAIDQTRGWFYTLHAVGTLMGRGKAFKNVICLGHVLDAAGKKMSKSLGNVIDPQVMMDRYGADALRFWMYSVNQPGESKNFEEKTVDEIVKKVFNLISNTAVFYKMYADNKVKPASDSNNVLDRWIIARLHQLVADATKNLDDYILLEPARAIRDFAADLSQWYLRRSRDRFKEAGSDKQAALATTKYVLLTLAKVMAPFTPFFAEELYRDVGGEKESVHLEDWPKTKSIDTSLLTDMESLRQVIEVALALRSYKKLGARQPLSELRYEMTVKRKNISEEMLHLIEDEVNVKKVSCEPIKENPQTSILEEKGWLFIDSGGVKIALDFNITPALKEEGDLRELLRKIQDMRKEKGLSVNDSATLTATDDLKDLISRHEKEIKAATHLTEIRFGDSFELKT